MSLEQTFQRPNYEQVVKKARDLLEEYCIEEPPVDVFALAEREGLSVIEAKFEDGRIAGLIDVPEERVIVNQDDAAPRQAFTVAHELGHWVLHRAKLLESPELSIQYRAGYLEQNEAWEKEANAFAAELLVPRTWLPSYEHLPIEKIAQIFGVSKEVIGYRFTRT
ncbi:MAG: ImmA/IrrE family metallo-endopeptidase [Armatimonadetes bacterium]|nr:ImmA/IrrE family metallo-endopeptidase [Armatimonadota bacterium]